MPGPAAHSPYRIFHKAPRHIFECSLSQCPHCNRSLRPRKLWHVSKTIHTLHSPLFVAGKSKECATPDCTQRGQHYYASQMLKL